MLHLEFVPAHPTILGREKDVPEESVLYGAVENLKIVTLW
jgi:hypothetical protein